MILHIGDIVILEGSNWGMASVGTRGRVVPPEYKSNDKMVGIEWEGCSTIHHAMADRDHPNATAGSYRIRVIQPAVICEND